MTSPSSPSAPESTTSADGNPPVEGGAEGTHLRFDPAPVVAKAGTYFRNARYIMVVLTIGMGVYFLYDGFIGYPKANAEFAAKPENKDAEGNFISKPPHSDTDVMLQKALGFTLPPLALVYFAMFMHKSRGQVRLDGDVITAPGHAPFRMTEVSKVDKKLWDRKGIALLSYRNAAGQSGTVKLDDFVYDRTPIDIIYYRTLLTTQFGDASFAPAVEAAFKAGAVVSAIKVPKDHKNPKQAARDRLEEYSYLVLNNAEEWKKNRDAVAKAIDDAEAVATLDRHHKLA